MVKSGQIETTFGAQFLHLTYNTLNGCERIDDRLICEDTISVCMKVDEEVTCSLRYKLGAQICHSGGFSQGHYWANINRNVKWHKCNDESVEQLSKHKLNNRYAYVSVYLKI